LNPLADKVVLVLLIETAILTGMAVIYGAYSIWKEIRRK